MAEIEPAAPPLKRAAEGTARPAPARQRALPTLRGLGRGGAALGGLFVFVFALQVIRSGAGGVVPIIDAINVAGPVNSVGFGWLFAYIVLSGSPVAAIGISLLAEGVLTEAEAFAVVGGSRLGASFIVLAVGFVYYLRRRRSADGLYVGVVALLTTFTTQGPAILLGLVSLHYGWLDRLGFDTPAGLLDLTDTVYGTPVDFIDGLLPQLGVFAAGVAILLLSFSLFDRALPQLEGEAKTITRALHFLHRRPLMFMMGCLVTLTTMSVAISITVLVPLSLRGYIKRDHIIPYVMGANITTFVDTLFASVLLGGQSAFTVVMTEMISVAIISVVILIFFYRPYSAAILRVTAWSTATPRHLGLFLGAIVAMPLVLLVV